VFYGVLRCLEVSSVCLGMCSEVSSCVLKYLECVLVCLVVSLGVVLCFKVSECVF